MIRGFRAVRQGLRALARLAIPGAGVMVGLAVPSHALSPEAAARMLAGAWSNARQYAAADAALKRPPAAGHPYDWLDLQHARFTPVRVPALGPGGATIYLVWRAGGPGGPVSRERLWHFRRADDGGVEMDFFTLGEAPAAADSGAAGESAGPPAPGAVLDLPAARLLGYGPQCALPVRPLGRGWEARIPETCIVTARSGRRMRLEAQIRVDGRRLSYDEAGLLEDGGIAFRVPGGPPYLFERED